MKLRATDTVLITSVKNENLLQGEEFEVENEDAAQKLVDRGLAEKVEDEPAKPAKAEKPPKPAPQNKGTLDVEKKD